MRVHVIVHMCVLVDVIVCEKCVLIIHIESKQIVIPEPVSRNSSRDNVSRNQRIKPLTRGVQARQEFIARKHRLPTQGGDPNGLPPKHSVLPFIC